jgi:hypothetical protein
MARKGGVDRGITQCKVRKGWWVRLYANGRQRWFKCDTKSQAKALYGRIKAEIREGKYFPDRFSHKQDITLGAWIRRYLEGCSNRGVENEQRYGRRWSLLIGKRLVSEIKTEDLRRIQAVMRARTLKGKRQWADATINRHFAFLRHSLTLAVQDGLLHRNPVSGVKFFPEARVHGFFPMLNLTTYKKS